MLAFHGPSLLEQERQELRDLFGWMMDDEGLENVISCWIPGTEIVFGIDHQGMRFDLWIMPDDQTADIAMKEFRGISHDTLDRAIALAQRCNEFGLEPDSSSWGTDPDLIPFLATEEDMLSAEVR